MQTWTIDRPGTVEIPADEPMTRLSVRLASGRLSVVGTDGPPRVEVRAIGETAAEVRWDRGTATVTVEPEHTWPGLLAPLWWWLRGGTKAAADVSVAVPYDTACTLRLASGSLVVSDLRAEVRVDCASGRLTLLGLHAPVTGKVVSGPIEALGCTGALDLETVSGEIVLADSATARVRAKTISGALIADLDNPPHDSNIDLETISGEITIRVREDSDLSVRMNAVHGRVTTDFPELRVEPRRGANAQGRLGSGSGRLIARAVGGSISLLRRPVDADFDAGGDT